MSYYEQMAEAERILHAAEHLGTHDEALGISPEDRAVINRVHGGGPLEENDLAELQRMGRWDLITTADETGRLDITTNHQEN